MKILSLSHHNFKIPGEHLSSVVPKILRRYGNLEGLIVLDSNYETLCETSSLRHLIFLEPVLKLCANRTASWIEDRSGVLEKWNSSWGVYENWLDRFINTAYCMHDIPLCAGCLSYEMLHGLESVPFAKTNNFILPDSLFYVYRSVIEIYPSGRAVLHKINFSSANKPFWKAEDIKEILCSKESLPNSRILETARPPDALSLEEIELRLSPFSNFTKERYLYAAALIKELIGEGEVYEVNLSQQFMLPFDSSRAGPYYLALRKANPARFSCYLRGASNEGTPFSITSASPELFFKCRGRTITCSPIKGTCKRSKDPVKDRAAKAALLASEKDLAELSMIVDLVRNDMGRIAKTGSVKVVAHARLESHRHLHHLVSQVSSTLASDKSVIDGVKALFPCGSITGAPKIAAMKYISEIENTTRSVYTGSIGWFGTAGSAELNVAIRTAVTFEDRLIFNSGGAIVTDSIPRKEYEETLTKAQGLFLAYDSLSKSSQKRDCAPAAISGESFLSTASSS